MATLSEMRSRIADDLDRSDLSVQIDQAINRAIRFYTPRYFWFTQATATWLTTPEQSAYTLAGGLPSDLKDIDFMTISVNGHRTLLRRVPYDVAQTRGSFEETGCPYHYTWYAHTLHLFPTPDQAYSITMGYTKRYEPLVLDTQTNDFLTQAEDLIEARALWWVNQRLLKDDRAAQTHKAEELEALQGLLGETEQLVLSQRLGVTAF